jgi:hypothetical protein
MGFSRKKAKEQEIKTRLVDKTVSRKAVLQFELGIASAEKFLQDKQKQHLKFITLEQKRDRMRELVSMYHSGEIGLAHFNKELDKLRLQGAMVANKGRRVLSGFDVASRKQWKHSDRNFVGALTAKQSAQFVTDIYGNNVQIADESTNLNLVVRLINSRLDSSKLDYDKTLENAFALMVSETLNFDLPDLKEKSKRVFCYILCDGTLLETYKRLATLQSESRKVDSEKGYVTQSPMLITKNKNFVVNGDVYAYQKTEKFSVNLVNQSYDSIVNYSEKQLIRSGKAGNKKLANTPRPSDLRKVEKMNAHVVTEQERLLDKQSQVSQRDREAIRDNQLKRERSKLQLQSVGVQKSIVNKTVQTYKNRQFDLKLIEYSLAMCSPF